MERQSTVRLTFASAVACAVALGACGGAQAPDASPTDSERMDVDTADASASSSASWRDRFKRPEGTSPQRPPATSGMGPFSTDERTSNASDRKRAKELFSEGLKLMEAENFEEACPKFLGAHELVPGGLVLLRLSLCLEAAGDVAGACEAARASVVMLERKGGASPEPKLNEAKTRIMELRCR